MQLAEGYQLKNIIEGCVEIEQVSAQKVELLLLPENN
jgi:hypothetical protein